MKEENTKNELLNKFDYKLIISVFSLYLIVLLVGLIFKFAIPQLVNDSYLILENKMTLKDNFINGLSFGILMSTKRFLIDIFLNIVAFIPLGLILPFVFKKINIIRDLLISFAVSLSIELIEAFTRLGYFNLIDTIFNLIGSGIGIVLVYFLINRISNKVITYLLYICLALLIAFVIYLIVAFSINHAVYDPIFDYTKYPYLV